MMPAGWRPRTTSLIVGCFLTIGLAAVAMLPLWLGLVSLVACACGAFLAYGRQVYVDCLDGHDLA
jgi:hypothetical protein